MAITKRIVGEMFYSNCLLEALKAKIRNPKIKITYLSLLLSMSVFALILCGVTERMIMILG